MSVYSNKPVRTPPDTFEASNQELDSPARFAFEITPGAGDLTVSTRGLYIGTSGNVFCRMSGYANNLASGAEPFGGQHANIFFRNVVGGTILPIRVDKVWSVFEGNSQKDTTAEDLVGLY
jgi:hypothetical protein